MKGSGGGDGFYKRVPISPSQYILFFSFSIPLNTIFAFHSASGCVFLTVIILTGKFFLLESKGLCNAILSSPPPPLLALGVAFQPDDASHGMGVGS